MPLQVTHHGSPDNPTILFLHGLGFSSWMWDAQVQALKSSYHCVTLDLPGNGGSHTHPWVSFAESADAIAALLPTIAPAGGVHVVGLSLGGYTALHLLARHSHLLASVLVSGITTRPLTPTWMWRGLMGVSNWMLFSPMITTLNLKLLNLPADIAPYYQADTKVLRAATVDTIQTEVLAFTLPQQLAQNRVRLLVVVGDKETGVVKASLADIVTTVPNARAAIAPNAHHGWNGEHPELFSQMIAAWVENAPLPSVMIPVGQQATSDR